MTYEYKVTDLGAGQIEDVITEMGADGWRLVTVDNFRFYWEKQVKKTSKE